MFIHGEATVCRQKPLGGEARVGKLRLVIVRTTRHEARRNRGDAVSRPEIAENGGEGVCAVSCYVCHAERIDTKDVV